MISEAQCHKLWLGEVMLVDALAVPLRLRLAMDPPDLVFDVPLHDWENNVIENVSRAHPPDITIGIMLGSHNLWGNPRKIMRA